MPPDHVRGCWPCVPLSSDQDPIVFRNSQAAIASGSPWWALQRGQTIRVQCGSPLAMKPQGKTPSFGEYTSKFCDCQGSFGYFWRFLVDFLESGTDIPHKRYEVRCETTRARPGSAPHSRLHLHSLLSRGRSLPLTVPGVTWTEWVRGFLAIPSPQRILPVWLLQRAGTERRISGRVDNPAMLPQSRKRCKLPHLFQGGSTS